MKLNVFVGLRSLTQPTNQDIFDFGEGIAFNEMIYDRISLKADGRDIYNYKIIVSTTSF